MRTDTSMRREGIEAMVVSESVVLVGVVGGPFGVNGWSHVKSYTHPPENLLAYLPWQIQRDAPASGDTTSGWEVVDVEAERHGGGLIARFPGAQDRDAASAMRGRGIGVHAEALPAPDEGEYYWRDLVGARVVNKTGAEIGSVERLFETPAHDVMVVVDDIGKRLIPFVREWVVDVAPDAKRVVVDWEADWR